jgi:hypothetical protein
LLVEVVAEQQTLLAQQVLAVRAEEEAIQPFTMVKQRLQIPEVVVVDLATVGHQKSVVQAVLV